MEQMEHKIIKKYRVWILLIFIFIILSLIFTMLVKDFDVLGFPFSALLIFLGFSLGIVGFIFRAVQFWRRDNNLMAILFIIAAILYSIPLFFLIKFILQEI
ncbi:hypothetical protein [Peribacillus sp. SCS-37]|uniref:hypothetical protein n=1 Tax=Paraperibacillus esterisolvens TaxID=3115296 RepID=UPI00390670F2